MSMDGIVGVSPWGWEWLLVSVGMCVSTVGVGGGGASDGYEQPRPEQRCTNWEGYEQPHPGKYVKKSTKLC